MSETGITSSGWTTPSAMVSVGWATTHLPVHLRCAQILNRPLVDGEFFDLLFHFVIFLLLN